MKEILPRDLLNCICGGLFSVSVIDIRSVLKFQRSHIWNTELHFDFDSYFPRSLPTKNDVLEKFMTINMMKQLMKNLNTFFIFIGGGGFLFYIDSILLFI
jgi:hypothetical protein